MDKRAYYFSLDAFIALLVILAVVLFIRPPVGQVSEQINVQQDLISVLSAVKIGDLEGNTKTLYIQPWIADGTITNLNQTVLEQIGEFYAKSDSKASTLAYSIFSDLDLNPNSNVGLYFNGQEIAKVGSVDFSNSKNVWTSRQIITGIQQGSSATGFSSRAFLFAENKIKYFYFGGYIGDGNITLDVGNDAVSANIEAVFGGDFDLYVNDVFIQTHSPSSNVPYKFNINSTEFVQGDNQISFKSDLSNLYIAGGFVKVFYSGQDVLVSEKKKNIAGIDGLANIYDSFYVPGDLNNMEVFLHYNSSYNIFLTVGNTTVYEGNSSGDEVSVTLTNSELQSFLDYGEITNKTIPFRLGLSDVSYISNKSDDIDVFSVTDISGSMSASCQSANIICCFFSGDTCTSNSSCDGCEGYLDDKIGLAKEANRVFIDSVLDISGNRVGLVGYQTQASASDFHSLSTDRVALKSKIGDWKANGGTCICCGVNKAAVELNQDYRENTSRSIVVMSDGKANVKCSEQGTGDASQDAIQSACDAFDNYNVTVYAVGFGEDADEATLQSIASCGHGNYYYGDVNHIIEIYKQIAQDIINASYVEQTVVGEGISTKLYPDSYVFLDYDKTIPFGLVITAESDEFGNSISEGEFYIPSDSTPYEATVISYSGSKWTDNVFINNSLLVNWDNVFNISLYGEEYLEIGDPYVINLPLEKLGFGNNSVRITTGVSPLNSTGGSPYNKVIYSVVKDLSGFSSIESSADGCVWNIEFEDNTQEEMVFPNSYLGIDVCTYTSVGYSYNENDAIDVAIYDLLLKLDLDGDGRIETKFSEGDLILNSIEVTGIPFTWETEVQARTWK